MFITGASASFSNILCIVITSRLKVHEDFLFYFH